MPLKIGAVAKTANVPMHAMRSAHGSARSSEEAHGEGCLLPSQLSRLLPQRLVGERLIPLSRSILARSSQGHPARRIIPHAVPGGETLPLVFPALTVFLAVSQGAGGARGLELVLEPLLDIEQASREQIFWVLWREVRRELLPQLLHVLLESVPQTAFGDVIEVRHTLRCT